MAEGAQDPSNYPKQTRVVRCLQPAPPLAHRFLLLPLCTHSQQSQSTPLSTGFQSKTQSVFIAYINEQMNE